VTDELNDRDDAPLTPELEGIVRAEVTPAHVVRNTRERLLARAAVDARARDAGPSAATPALTVSRGRGVSPALFGAVSLALAASVLFIVSTVRDRDAMRATYASADRAKDTRIDSLRTLVAARDQFVSSLTGSQVSVVGLSSSAAKNPRAMMFWDKATDKWTFVAHNLAPLPAGRTYQLWLVTATAKISAGTFTVSPKGDVMLQATYALDRNALKAVAVTEEPMGGMPQPTGAMVVVGAAATQ
jgi:hypothetical protein